MPETSVTAIISSGLIDIGSTFMPLFLKRKKRELLLCHFKEVGDWKWKRGDQNNSKKLYNSIRGGLAEGYWPVKPVDNDCRSFEWNFQSTLEGQKVEEKDIYEIDTNNWKPPAKIIVFVDHKKNNTSERAEFEGSCYNVFTKENIPGFLTPIKDERLFLKYRRRVEFDDCYTKFDRDDHKKNEQIIKLISDTESFITKKLKHPFDFKKLDKDVNNNDLDKLKGTYYLAHFKIVKIRESIIRIKLFETPYDEGNKKT